MHLIGFLIVFWICTSNALDNGLARKPPMGWMSWQRFRCQIDCVDYPNDCISERLIERNAKKLAADGYLNAGYRYVIIDDCWPSKQRDPLTHKLVPDPIRFPNGMDKLGKTIHNMGLLFGIYLDYGTYTCEGYPGTQHYLELDANTIAGWEVDYVKVDGCNSKQSEMPDGYEQFGKYLNLTKRPMIYSCSYPAYISWMQQEALIDWNRLQKNCNLWRMLADIQDSWDSVMSIINAYKSQTKLLSEIAGPGHWNDPDMLILGNFGLSKDQQRVQMGMWCMFAAPLLISTDMDLVDSFSANLLKNPHLIAIDQDVGGHQAVFVTSIKSVQLWTRKLDDAPEGYAIAALNAAYGGGPLNLKLSLKHFSINSTAPDVTYFKLIDAFTGITFLEQITLEKEFTVRVNPSGIVLYRVEQISPIKLLTNLIKMLNFDKQHLPEY